VLGVLLGEYTLLESASAAAAAAGVLLLGVLLLGEWASSDGG